MLYVFGFGRIGVALSDLYFVDPDPAPGQEGPEQGVRLEVRILKGSDHEGSIYASRRIVVAEPIWRIDLLESVEHPGSLDRAHHHPSMTGWEPNRRRFEGDLTADPLAWVADRLAHVDEVVGDAAVIDDDDLVGLRQAVPEIMDAVRRRLAAIRAADLAGTAAGGSTGTAAGRPAGAVRDSWL